MTLAADLPLLARFDETVGRYRVAVGMSAEDLRLHAELQLVLGSLVPEQFIVRFARQLRRLVVVVILHYFVQERIDRVDQFSTVFLILRFLLVPPRTRSLIRKKRERLSVALSVS